MCGHLEILSVRSANLPASEGIAFLSRNGSDYNIGIEVVDISADYLSANLVGDVVPVDAELSIETNGLCRHGERAVSSNRYDFCNVLPAGESIAFLFRMSGSYGYVSVEGVGIDAAKLRFGTLLILIEVGHLGIDRNPLCVQIQGGHQTMIRANFILGTVNIPAVEAESGRDGEHVITNGMCITAHCRNFAGLVGHAGDSAIVRVISYSNRNALDVAVNVVALFIALILDGVPHDLDVVYVEVLAQNRGIGRAVIVGTVGPVVLIEETEFCRRNQIVVAKAVNVVDTVGRVVVGAIGISHPLAFRLQRAFVTGLAS